MTTEYKIKEISDFNAMVKKFLAHFESEEREGNSFKPIRVIAKKLMKSKTSAQHRTYWRCVGEMKKAFREVGYEFNEDQIHNFVKTESGFTHTAELENGKTVMLVGSVADKSEAANRGNMVKLIDFMIRWSQENLNYTISIGDGY